MSETRREEQVLVLTDGSPPARMAVRIATACARALGQTLAVLGVGRGPEEDAAIGAAVQEAQTEAKALLPTVVAVQATGDLLAVARRRVEEVPTSLVLLGANRHGAEGRLQLPARVWSMAKTLSPPVLVASEEGERPLRWLFCTGGAHYIEEGAGFAAVLAAGLSASVTVFHVSPEVPGVYGDRLEQEEESADEFLRSNSRVARHVRRQIDIFREARVETRFHVRAGDIVDAVLAEIRSESYDLVVVGSSPTRGPVRSYLLGNATREIVTLTTRPFLVLRSRQPTFWENLWRA